MNELETCSSMVVTTAVDAGPHAMSQNCVDALCLVRETRTGLGLPSAVSLIEAVQEAAGLANGGSIGTGVRRAVPLHNHP